MKKIANDIMNTGIAVFFGTLFLLVALVTAQSIEQQFMPAVSNVMFVKVGDAYRVTGEKNRACSFVELRVLVQQDGVYQKGEVSFINDHGPRDRATGLQDFGLWRIIPPGDNFKIQAVHKCHFLWDSISDLKV